MTENEAKIFIQNAMEQSKKTLAELLLMSPKVFADRKKSLGEYYSNLENCKKEIQSCEVAIKALEEVQKYRAIGTPEELKTTMQYVRLAKAHRTVGRAIEECAKYEEIGTPEECRKSVEICKSMIERNITPEDMEEYMKFEDECVKDGFTFNSLLEAREKQTAKKIEIFNGQASCPNCKYLFGGMDVIKKLITWSMPHCKNCGQKLDWRNEE